MFLSPLVPERVWAKLIPEPNSGCWLWLGALNRGYGVLSGSRAGRKWTQPVHRFVYERLVGPIALPELDHKCRTPCCANPQHLEPVTRQENATRKRLARAHCKRGHLFTEKNTRWRGGARECKDCQRITGRELDKKRASGWERQRRAMAATAPGTDGPA